MYVLNGKVVLYPDGTGVDKQESDNVLYVQDVQTGKLFTIAPNRISELAEATDPQAVIAEREEAIAAAMNQEIEQEEGAEGGTAAPKPTTVPETAGVDAPQGDVSATQQQQTALTYESGSRFTLDLPNGSAVNGVVLQVTPDGVEVQTSSPVNEVFPTDEFDGMLSSVRDEEGDVIWSKWGAGIPVDAKTGEPVYDAVAPDVAWDAIVQEAEGDEAMAMQVVTDMVADMEAKVQKAKKAKVRAGSTVREKLEAQKKRKRQIEEAEAQLEAWKRIAAVKAERIAAAERAKIEAADAEGGTERDKGRVGTENEGRGNKEKENDETEVIGSSMTADEALDFIADMELGAEIAPEIDLTIENWDALFGKEGIVSTPIGNVKMGENQFTKLMRQGRNGKLGMIKPTLEHPHAIIADVSEAKEGDITERASSYVFIRSFKKVDGSRYYYFTSITVSKDGKEVVISNQEKRRNAIANLLTKGKLVWKHADDVSDASDMAQGLYSSQGNVSDLATEGTDAPQTTRSSTGKDTPENRAVQTSGQENAETSSEGGISSISHAENQSAPAISLQSRGDVVSISNTTGKDTPQNSAVQTSKNDIVWPEPTVGSNANTDTAEVANNPTEVAKGETVDRGGNSSQPISSESKDTPENRGVQTSGQENAETSLQSEVTRAEQQTNAEPTEGQKEAGNYKKGRVKVGPFDVVIEQPRGSVRSGVDANGKAWETTMQHTYGYFGGTKGVDGDAIDVFLAHDLDEWDGTTVFVVDQYNPDGSFDEHKVMLGFNSQEEAEAAYFANYEADWAKTHRTEVTAVPLADFNEWVNSSKRKTKAFAAYKVAKRNAEIDAHNAQNEQLAEQLFSMAKEAETEKDFFDRAASLFEVTGYQSDLRDIYNGVKSGEIANARALSFYTNATLKPVAVETDSNQRNANDNLQQFYTLIDTALAGGNSSVDDVKLIRSLSDEELVLAKSYKENRKGRSNKAKIDVSNIRRHILDEIQERQNRKDLAKTEKESYIKGLAYFKKNVYPGFDFENYIKNKEKEYREAVSKGRLGYAAILKGVIRAIKEVRALAEQKESANETVKAGVKESEPKQATKNSKAGEKARKHAAQPVAPAVSTQEATLRDALVDVAQQSGLEVVVDEKAQQVLDEVNGRARFNAKQKRALETASLSQREKDQPTVVSSADGANVLKKLDILATDLTEKSNRSKTFLGDLANALGASTKGSSSQYATFETINGQIVTIRLANHNASTKRMDDAGRDNAISIVISPKPNEGILNDGDAHIVEFYYNSIKLRKAEGHPLAEIVRSIKQSLYSGEYKDTTGLAEIQEVNTTFEKLREHRVFHGSGAEFDAFDHSHMGEGEGAQAYGWGTYVTEVEGIGRAYARNPWQMKINELESNISRAKEKLPFMPPSATKTELENNIKEWEEELAKLENGNKHLYTVEIPEDNGSNYLHWEEQPGKEQLSAVAEALKADGWSEAEGNHPTFTKGDNKIVLNERTTGSDVYAELEESLGSQQKASEILSSIGFTGISYPAEARSGGRTDAARNFVIFNEKDAQITDHIRFFRTPGGEAYGFTVDGKIYLDPRIATAETPIHEYAHLWADMIRNVNAEAWNDIVGLMKATPIWEEVRGLYPELKTDDEIADEVLAHYSGRRGAERLREAQQQAATETGKSVFERAAAVAAIERVKQALAKFWQSVAELFHIRFTSAEEVADRVLADMLNGVNPNQFTRQKNGKVRQQFVGQQGAAALDKAEEATTRLDNLGVAREMESQQKDAKAIKLATGWERGGDGKWRYEVQDFDVDVSGTARRNHLNERLPWGKEYDALLDKVFDGETLTEAENARLDELMSLSEELQNTYKELETRYLDDYVKDRSLFDAYPELKQVRVEMFNDPTSGVGATLYNESKLIRINEAKLENNSLQSLLAHEVQYAIQHIEGFAMGGNSTTYREHLAGFREKYEAWSVIDEFEDKSKELGDDARPIDVYNALVREYQSLGLEFGDGFAPCREAFDKGFNLWTRGYDNEGYEDAYNEYQRLMGKFGSGEYNNRYDQLAGEVEARNVQKRLHMTPEERRQSLAEETEDVARKDQIFIMENVGGGNASQYSSSSMVSPLEMSDAEKYERGERLRNAPAVDVASNQIVKTDTLSARKAAEKWWAEHASSPLHYQTEIGDVVIDNNSIGNSLAHRYGQAKLDAITSLKEGFKNAVYLGTLPDSRERGVIDHYFSYPIQYNGEKCYVFCRALHDANKNQLYVHEVFVADKIKKGNTLQTAASKPHGGIALYKDILANVLDAAKVAENSETSQLPEENNFREGKGELSDDMLSYLNDPMAQMMGKPRGTKKQRAQFAERERGRMQAHAEKLVERLHLSNVEIVTDASQLEGKQRTAKGFYNKRTGKITIVLPNHASTADVEQTLLHEAVAHYGLRQLFGEHFDDFLDMVYRNAEEGIRRKIAEASAKHGWNVRTATEEYLADLAERTDFEHASPQWWAKIKGFFLDMLRGLGFEAMDGQTLTDNELRYVLWRSYENLTEPGKYPTFIAEARDVAKQHALQVGRFAPTETVGSRVAENEALSEEEMSEILFRDGSTYNYTQVLARDRYERRIKSGMYQTKEALQDSMLGLRTAMESILEAEGRKGVYIEDIDGFENAYLGENRLSSVNQAEAEKFAREVFAPMLEEVSKLAPTAEERAKLIDYLFAKHGLERNEVMARRAAAKEARKEFEKELRAAERAVAKQKRALETASLENNSRSLTVVSSADGANVQKVLDILVTDLTEMSNRFHIFLGDLAQALGASTKSSSSQYGSVAKRCVSVAFG